MPLSDAKIRILKATDKAYKVSDFDGLFLLIKVSGSKSWRFKYRLSGKEKLLVIGDYPGISLAQARLARDAARTLVANKTVPSDAKQGKAGMEGDAKAQTFTKLAAAFLEKNRGRILIEV
jgi:Arm DNA-binding domain